MLAHKPRQGHHCWSWEKDQCVTQPQQIYDIELVKRERASDGRAIIQIKYSGLENVVGF